MNILFLIMNQTYKDNEKRSKSFYCVDQIFDYQYQKMYRKKNNLTIPKNIIDNQDRPQNSNLFCNLLIESKLYKKKNKGINLTLPFVDLKKAVIIETDDSKLKNIQQIQNKVLNKKLTNQFYIQSKNASQNQSINQVVKNQNGTKEHNLLRKYHSSCINKQQLRQTVISPRFFKPNIIKQFKKIQKLKPKKSKQNINQQQKIQQLNQSVIKKHSQSIFSQLNQSLLVQTNRQKVKKKFDQSSVKKHHDQSSLSIHKLNQSAIFQHNLRQTFKSQQSKHYSKPQQIKHYGKSPLNNFINNIINPTNNFNNKIFQIFKPPIILSNNKFNEKRQSLMHHQISARSHHHNKESNLNNIKSSCFQQKKHLDKVIKIYKLPQNLYYISTLFKNLQSFNSIPIEHLKSAMNAFGLNIYHSFRKMNKAFIKKKYQNRKTLFLDLDQTLVYCKKATGLKNFQKKLIYNINGQIIEMGLNIRPYAKQVLFTLSKYYQLVLFTAGNKIYADKILDQLDPKNTFFHHRLYRDSCLQIPDSKHPNGGLVLKDLDSILGINLSQSIIVDNTPTCYYFHKENSIPIYPYSDNKNDDELLKLLQLLIFLKQSTDVRSYLQNYFKMHKYREFKSPHQLIKKLYINSFKSL